MLLLLFYFKMFMMWMEALTELFVQWWLKSAGTLLSVFHMYHIFSISYVQHFLNANKSCLQKKKESALFCCFARKYLLLGVAYARFFLHMFMQGDLTSARVPWIGVALGRISCIWKGPSGSKITFHIHAMIYCIYKSALSKSCIKIFCI